MAGISMLAGLLIAAGDGLGVWFNVGHYRPLLDAASTDLVTTKASRDNLEALACN